MCGRFSLWTSAEVIKKHFNLKHTPLLKPRYNVAPGQFVPVIREPGQLDFLTWGFRPQWLKEDQNSFINARMETVTDKPAFRYAFNKHRCLIVVDGYYEWRTLAKGKQPYYVTLPENELIAFAGLWVEDTCAILTKDAQFVELAQVHERMPVILAKENYDVWLNPKTKVPVLQDVMKNNDIKKLLINPVSTTVNNPINDVAACIKPIH